MACKPEGERAPNTRMKLTVAMQSVEREVRGAARDQVAVGRPQLMRHPLGVGIVFLALVALTAASNSPGAATRDDAVVEAVLVLSGSVETYFGIVHANSYVMVAPVVQEYVDWQEVGVVAREEGGHGNGEVQSALQSLEARGKQPWSIPSIEWGPHLRAAPEDPMTIYRRDGTWADAWPGSVGVAFIAAPGFSASGRSALVYWARTRGVARGELLYGDSVLTYLERGKDRWHIKWERVVHAA